MAIFKIEKGNLIPIKELRIDLEKDLQQVTEASLENIFGLRMISSEFTLHNFRIDTLAFDAEAKSFVIIEYKRDRSFSVIDQGFAYLSLMLNNKADFILEYNEKLKSNLKREDVDWSQSRVLFLANTFTAYQQNAINFQDLPIELWEVKKFDNNTVLYNQLKAPSSNESIKTIARNDTLEKVSKEIKKYKVDDLFGEDWQKSRELYEKIRAEILQLDERIEEKFNKYYIGFKISNKNLVGLRIQKSKIMVDFTRTRPQDLEDPKKRLGYIKNSIKYFNQHMSKLKVENESDVDYAMFLIKQSYEKFYK